MGVWCLDIQKTSSVFGRRAVTTAATAPRHAEPGYL